MIILKEVVMMNEPLINPWLIYLLDVSDVIKCTMFVIAVASGVLTLFVFCADREMTTQTKRAAIIFIVCTVLAIFVPSERTMYKMIIASYVTPANIQKAGDSIDIVIDKVIEKIQKFQINTNPK